MSTAPYPAYTDACHRYRPLWAFRKRETPLGTGGDETRLYNHRLPIHDVYLEFAAYGAIVPFPHSGEN